MIFLILALLGDFLMIVATGSMIMTGFLMSIFLCLAQKWAVSNVNANTKSSFFIISSFQTSIGRGDQFARLAQELNQTQLRLLFQFNTGFQALRALAQRLEVSEVERSPTCHCFSNKSALRTRPWESSVHRLSWV